MSYSESTLASKDIFHTNRDLREYCECLRIEPEDFLNKQVLDIGSGREGIFANELVEMLQGEAQVVSYDIQHAKRNKNSVVKNAVAGYFTELPFKDDAFDAIVSLYAFPLYLLRSPELLNKGFTEIIRVLKERGVIKLYPVKYREFVALEDLAHEEQLPVSLHWTRNLSVSDSVTNGLLTVTKTIQ